FALRVTGNSASDLWSQQLPTAPSSAPNLWSNILLIPGTNNRLYARNRLNGDPLWEVETPAGGSLQYPVVGGQMVYVGNRTLRALYLDRSGETVWEDIRFNAVSATPVYGQPGVLALAEVYAADSGGNIYAFDANTGRYLWTHPSGEQTQMMALDESTL